MKQVFAETGSGLQQVGGTCPAGWIVMQGERPTPEHVAQEDGAWVLPPTPVPASVSMRQARLAMLRAGILAEAKALLESMPGEEGEIARIDWEFAQDVRRDWPLVIGLGRQLSMTNEQIDDLFILAGSIPQ